MANNVIGLFDNQGVADQVVGDLESAGFSSSTINRFEGSNDSLHDELLREGIPDDEASYYVDGLSQGGALVSVHAEDDQTDTAVEIMNRYANLGDDTSADYDPDYDAEPVAGTTGLATEERTDYDSSRASTQTSDGQEKLAIAEEQLRIGKRQVQRGGVRVRSVVKETPVEEQVTLRDETINVERRPVDRAVTSEDDNVFREKSYEFSETDEEAVVSKESRVVEEVVVGKSVEEKTETVRDTVRRTDVEVEQLSGGATRESYDETSPAYSYGQTLASDSRYEGREWNDIEADARRDWETNHSDQGAWENFKDSVRGSWERARR